MPGQTESPAGPQPVGHRARLVRFGPFEANLGAETVRSNGSFVQIQQQPFLVLAALLERPGEVVTREELRQRLWPDGLHVDFEHSLNTAVKKVRLALDDSPDEPRYVETVRGRGYRFIASVETRALPAARARRAKAGLWSFLGVLVVVVGLIGAVILGSRRMGNVSVQVVPLTSAPGAEYQPTFSPDGTEVAFTWRHGGNEDVYVQRVGIPELRPLAAGPAVEHSPAWSPDGRLIAFIRDPMEIGGRARVIVVPPRGGPERVVTEYAGSRLPGLWRRQLDWSDDSRHLVLSRPDEEGETWSLYRLALADGGLLRLTESPGVDETPALSPDDRRLAFTRRLAFIPHRGEHDRSEIHLLSLSSDLEPSGPSRALVRQEDLRDFQNELFFMPVWTPDGREVVFTGFSRGPDIRLYRRGVGPAAGVQRLPEGVDSLLGLDANLLGDPVFRPKDEELVAACWNTRGWDTAQVTLEGDRPSVSAAPFSSSRGEGRAVLSPDGQRAAFVSDRLGGHDIWLSRLDGTELRRLTANTPYRYGGRVWSLADLAWSPDGRWIAHGALVGENWDVYVVPTGQGDAPRRLTQDAGRDSGPAWSRDGNWVYFVSDRDGSSRIWKVPIGGGAPRRVSQPNVAHPVPSPDGRFLYFARAGPEYTRVWRMPAEGGEEELVLGAINNPWSFDLHLEHVYYFGPREPDGKAPLLKRDLVTSEEETLARVDGPGWDGLAVTPDGRLAFYPRVGPPSADLVMITGW
jgi:Tol biopolymer transport system component/DNA-binding winged helix-turn-helix (wHTH) protein